MQLTAHDRHLAHALGDARRADAGQRASALSRRRDRRRAQRHHRELRGAARPAEGARLRVPHADRHRSHRASRALALARDGRRRSACAPCSAAVAEFQGAYAIAVISTREPGRVVGARAGQPAASSASASDDHFLASDAAALLPVTRRVVVSRGRRRRRRAPRVVRDLRRAAASSVERAVVDGGERRATRSSSARTATSCRRRSSSSRARSPTRWRASRRSSRRCSARTRAAILPEGRQRARSSRAARATTRASSRSNGSRRSPACRARSRSRANTAIATACRNPNALVVVVSQSGETADTLAALKHAQVARPRAHARDLQRRDELDGAADGAHVSDARRHRDRRRVDEGVHDAARRAVPAGADAREAARATERASEEANWLRALRHLPAALQAALALEPHLIGVGASSSRRSSTRCSSAAACTIRSRSKAR